MPNLTRDITIKLEITNETLFAAILLICCALLVAFDKLDVENFMKVTMILVGYILKTSVTYLRARPQEGP